MRRTFLIAIGAIVALLAACGDAATDAPPGGGGDPDAAAADDAMQGDGGTGDGGTRTDSGTALTDGGGNGAFSRPLTCSGMGAFKPNYAGSCGIERWAIKTGADPAAPSISLLPQLSTIAALGALPPPTPIPFSTRVNPTEATVFALRDVKLTFARLEDDGDYHLVLTDGASTMIAEIPYPGGTCIAGSAWPCFISKARAAVDAQLTLAPLKGKVVDFVVSVAGVGFFDTEHSQFGAAPNAIELHPALAICFGAGCSLGQ